MPTWPRWSGWPELKRKRQELDRRHATLLAQQRQLKAVAKQRLELRAVADGIEALCQTIRAGLATATFAQRRLLAELLIDRVVVSAKLPMASPSPRTCPRQHGSAAAGSGPECGLPHAGRSSSRSASAGRCSPRRRTSRPAATAPPAPMCGAGRATSKWLVRTLPADVERVSSTVRRAKT